ncbi:MAG: hypothetical protein D6741_09835 [Planctomycetota bacterium]|nr:MAG: hypothetical protein D6741_09835 [Planctomycetota bacterium]
MARSISNDDAPSPPHCSNGEPDDANKTVVPSPLRATNKRPAFEGEPVARPLLPHARRPTMREK